MWKNDSAFLLSKIYIDDFLSIVVDENEINTEAFCAVKSILKILSSKKDHNFETVKYLFKKYKKLKSVFLFLNNTMPNFPFSDFIKCVNSNNYQKASDFADSLLEQMHKLDHLYLNSKNEIINRQSYFLTDYQRIVSCSAFRRLQDKTQLFLMTNEDFSRRRLTHSIEVSSYAEKIAMLSNIEKIIEPNKNFNVFDFYDCAYVARCAGVLHDIGNPPFGHNSESVINNFFDSKNIIDKLNKFGLKNNTYLDDLKCFDGNAQSLRIATKLMSFDNKDGASLTAGVLGSIIKYPHPYSKGNKKIGYYLSERSIINDLKMLGVYRDGVRNPFACILEVADDICYLISDLEDSIHKQIVTFDTFNKVFKKRLRNNEIKDFYMKYTSRFLSAKQKSNSFNSFESIIKPLLFQFRENIINEINNQRYKRKPVFQYIIENGVNENFCFLKKNKFFKLFMALKKVKDTVFKSDIINEAEKQSEKCISYLLNCFFNALLICNINFKQKKLCIKDSESFDSILIQFLPENLVHSFFKEIKTTSPKELVIYYKMRLLIDFISGMTDGYARKLFLLVKDSEKLKKA